ncbi:Glycosyltransferase [hydrothermal vent metagenome]|uniref:Glycosyltransferase n=1 Tax=hydrothermal vent metagenome TaxID=652676 RepID=A0A3B0VGH4_9ZZZZ
MNRPIVVIQIIPALNSGGVERGTVEVANYLAALGHTSVVISAGGIMLTKLSAKVEHITLEVGKKSLLSLKLIKSLRQLFIDKKVDIVHARSRLPAWLAYKAIVKIKSHKPQFITTVHGLYSVKKYSAIMAKGDRVIAVSNTALQYVIDNYAKYLKYKPQLIYRGINSDEFPYGYIPKVKWLKAFNQLHPKIMEHKIVLLPGRLTALKGVKELKTWLKSTDNSNNAKLVLTANPENDVYASKLNQWFSHNNLAHKVVWIGLQSAMAELYALADVVVSPSIRPESFGRTVVESLAIGTPVVGYNHGGVGEILTEIFPQGKVELGNRQQLSDKINQVLEQSPQVEDKQPFQLDNMLSQTLKLYHEVIDAV